MMLAVSHAYQTVENVAIVCTAIVAVLALVERIFRPIARLFKKVDDLGGKVDSLSGQLKKHETYVGYHLGPNGNTVPIHKRIARVEDGVAELKRDHPHT